MGKLLLDKEQFDDLKTHIGSIIGTMNPDEFYVYKPTYKKGYKALLKKRLGGKKMQLIYSRDTREPVKNVPVAQRDRVRFSYYRSGGEVVYYWESALE